MKQRTAKSGQAAKAGKPKKNLQARIARSIGERILGGEFAPGMLLPKEAEWGTTFGASRTAVREAVKALAAKGLISSRPKIGSRVEPKARWNLLDRDVLDWHRTASDRKAFLVSTQELRRIVEPGIAEIAAKKRTAAQIDQLVAALDAMRKANSHVETVAADLSFHQALLLATNNDLLMPFGVLIEQTLGNLFDYTTQRNTRYKQALTLHANIAKAVIAGNSIMARKAMLELIGDTDQVIAAVSRRKTS